MTCTVKSMVLHHLKVLLPSQVSRSIPWAVACICTAALIGFLVLDPIWQHYGLHVPGEPNTKADFTYPVDTVFYIRNAEWGYRWSLYEPTSIWFHPLLSWGTRILPNQIPANLRFYFLSLLSALLSLIIIHRYSLIVFNIRLKPSLLLLAVFVPGGLNIAVGNAELTSLLFNSLLLMAIINRYSGVLAFTFGALSILTKPNAIYMLAPLTIYGIHGFVNRDKEYVLRCILGILGITLTWIIWIMYVDMRVGEIGAYWQARQIAMVPLYAGPITLIYRAVQTMTLGELGEILKFVIAFAIPVLDMWLVLLAPFRNEVHRLASMTSILAMLLIMFMTNNPNKIIVYAMTLPSHLAVNLVTIQVGAQHVLRSVVVSKGEQWLLRFALIGYILLCASMIIFFVIGTPLGWYY